MKRNRLPNRNPWTYFYLLRFGVLILFSAVPAQGVQRGKPQPVIPPPAVQIQKPSVLNVRVEDGMITATISNSPLQDVLQELAARTGIIFEVRSQENPLVSVRLSRVPPKEAIERIAVGNNTIFFYGNDPAESGRITFVQIFPRQNNSPQPSILYLGTGAVTKSKDMDGSVEQALKILAESPNVGAREMAVEVLGNNPDKQAMEGLIKAVSDPAPQIRVSVIESLAALNARVALPDIVKSLKDPHPAVRQSAATAVGILGSSQNLKDLKPLSADRDASVAAAADIAIQKLSEAAKR